MYMSNHYVYLKHTQFLFQKTPLTSNSSLPEPLVPTLLLSVSTNLTPLPGTSWKWNHTLFVLCDGLLSISRMSSRFIHSGWGQSHLPKETYKVSQCNSYEGNWGPGAPPTYTPPGSPWGTFTEPQGSKKLQVTPPDQRPAERNPKAQRTEPRPPGSPHG